MSLRICVGVALAIGSVTVVSVPVGRADIFGVTDARAPAPRNDADLVLTDANGLASSLPAGVNTDASEFHPSVSADGTRLVFESDPAPDTRRIVVVDLTTGQSADLLNGFEAASIKPMAPSITPDGKAALIATGNGTGPLLIDLSNFPSGPYPRTDVGRGSFALGPVAAGSAPGSPFAFTDSSGLEVGTIGGSSFKQVQAANTFLDLHPTFGSPGGTPTLVFDSLDAAFNSGPIFFCSPFSPTTACQPQELPGIVNTAAAESRPAFTPDGRYIGFLRTVAGHQRLFVWDTGSQLLLNSSGVDLGPSTSALSGNLSLFEKFVFRGTAVSTLGVVRFSLLSASLVGIVVQRVVGHQRLFGRTVPKLGPAQRVPLGSFGRGGGRAKWNLRVHGKRLRAGTYQVTPRALTRSGKVRDLGKPRLLRIRG